MMKFGLSVPEKSLDKYLEWLNYFNKDFELIDWKKKNDKNKIEDCNGLILTGGVDIFPELYCDWKSESDNISYSPERDGFEIELIEKAIERRIPVLGICRGCQLINVFFKGNLIYDLEKMRNVNHKKISEEEPRFHTIEIYDDTLLKDITIVSNGIVTSTHHQSVDRLGEGLIINARSGDGVIEGIEYSDKMNKHFLLGIQWHPERFSDFNNPFSKNILSKFYEETLKI